MLGYPNEELRIILSPKEKASWSSSQSCTSATQFSIHDRSGLCLWTAWLGDNQISSLLRNSNSCDWTSPFLSRNFALEQLYPDPHHWRGLLFHPTSGREVSPLPSPLQQGALKPAKNPLGSNSFKTEQTQAHKYNFSFFAQ